MAGYADSVKSGLIARRKERVQDLSAKILTAMLMAGHEATPKELAPKAVSYAEALIKEIDRLYGEEQVLGISASK